MERKSTTLSGSLVGATGATKWPKLSVFNSFRKSEQVLAEPPGVELRENPVPVGLVVNEGHAQNEHLRKCF